MFSSWLFSNSWSYILSLFFIILSLLIIFVYNCKNQKTALPTNWPIVGMIPGLLVNVHQLHDYVTSMMINSGGTFMFKGPWFANMDMLITTNPINIHHILSKNFENYPKGEKFHNMFDILGDGIFNSDGELWEIHRKVTMGVLKHPGFQSLLETTLWNKVENGLLPVLESVSGVQGKEIDLQDMFQRFTFDNICKLLLDHDPKSLSCDFPYVPCMKAFSDAEEAILVRHVTPPSLWKLQQLLRVGNEKKLSNARTTLDQFIYKCLNRKSKEYNNIEYQKEERFLVLRAFVREFKNQNCVVGDPIHLLRDTVTNLMVAGKDSTSSNLSWFFYLLTQNPTIEDKILKEIHTHLKVKMGERWNAKDLHEMVYLHGALNESLRLFPPLPYNHKSSLQPDILPSGNRVDQNMKIILPFYSMGRMKSIWGDDCMEFKPERWVSKVGDIKHEPSYKFPAFHAGPRTCVAKDMALYQMKIISSTIIYHYRIELVEGQVVHPADSMVLQMKHGLKVRLIKRSEVS